MSTTRCPQQTRTPRLSRHERQAAEFVAVMADVVVDRRLPYRNALAYWPDEWRERWGHRANDLEAQGLSWREAELRAFIEVLYQRRIAGRVLSK
jgi:hypothetical protein